MPSLSTGCYPLQGAASERVILLGICTAMVGSISHDFMFSLGLFPESPFCISYLAYIPSLLRLGASTNVCIVKCVLRLIECIIQYSFQRSSLIRYKMWLGYSDER